MQKWKNECPAGAKRTPRRGDCHRAAKSDISLSSQEKPSTLTRWLHEETSVVHISLLQQQGPRKVECRREIRSPPSLQLYVRKESQREDWGRMWGESHLKYDLNPHRKGGHFSLVVCPSIYLAYVNVLDLRAQKGCVKWSWLWDSCGVDHWFPSNRRASQLYNVPPLSTLLNERSHPHSTP